MERLITPNAVRIEPDDFDDSSRVATALFLVCLGAIERLRASGFDPVRAVEQMIARAREADGAVGILRRMYVHREGAFHEWILIDFVTPGHRLVLFDGEAPAGVHRPKLRGTRSEAIFALAQYAAEQPASTFCLCAPGFGSADRGSDRWVICVSCNKPMLAATFGQVVNERAPASITPARACSICGEIDQGELVPGPHHGPAGTLVLAGESAHQSCVDRLRFQ